MWRLNPIACLNNFPLEKLSDMSLRLKRGEGRVLGKINSVVWRMFYNARQKKTCKRESTYFSFVLLVFLVQNHYKNS